MKYLIENENLKRRGGRVLLRMILKEEPIQSIQNESVYGYEKPVRLCAFAFAVCILILLYYMPGTIPGMTGSIGYPTIFNASAILGSIADGILIVEMIRFFFGSHKAWSMRRHLLYVFLISCVCFIVVSLRVDRSIYYLG